MAEIINPRKNKIAIPTARSLSLATAYQAIVINRPALITITLSSTANFSITGGTINSATLIIGPTNAVASGIGTVVGDYSNSITGTASVGLDMNTIMKNSYTIALPEGWYFAVRQTSGTVSIVSTFDQQIG